MKWAYLHLNSSEAKTNSQALIICTIIKELARWIIKRLTGKRPAL